MKAGGLPLTLFKASEADWVQGERVNVLMRPGAETYKASWIFPLYVDEFVEVAASG